jgi:predicted transcriptional regulator
VLEYTHPVARRVEIQLPDDLVSKVEQAASKQGISVEQLVRESVEEKIQRDSQFEAAVGKVLEKNAELYRRLS